MRGFATVKEMAEPLESTGKGVILMSSDENMKDEFDYQDVQIRKRFYKEKETDKIWWVDTIGVKGLLEISFDKKTY